MSVFVEPVDASDFRRALTEEKMPFEEGGSSRSAAEAAELFILVAPTLAMLAIVVERLRRKRLPRTYLKIGDDGPEVWTDSSACDGRIFLVGADGSVEELPDREVSTETLLRILRPGQPGDGE